MAAKESGRQRVAIVTGGGAGIGAAIAEELGRAGTYVVTMDPLVSVDGAEQLPPPEETTAGRIVAAGGSARASSASVTDAAGVQALFADVAEEFGGLDAVINVAGITRPTSFARGSEDDWRGVLSVHLDGYRNVLGAALPIMAAVGRGHILGVTSGSGWRPADTGAYGCAKRSVASLTWQMGQHAPAGVVVNAISPIAMTRMVTAALNRRKAATPAASKPAASKEAVSKASKSSSTGGLSLGSMPAPDELGPLAAHLVANDFDSCNGQVLFAAGSEMAVIEAPRLLEVVDAAGTSAAHVLDTVMAGAFLPAEREQGSKGGSNPRFGSSLSAIEATEPVASAVGSCLVVSDRADLAAEVIAALGTRGVACRQVDVGNAVDFTTAADTLRDAVEADGPIDSVVVALSGGSSSASDSGGWKQVLADHGPIVDQIHTDAAWARAVSDLSDATQQPIRLATVTDATHAGGQSRAQSSAQLARSALGGTAGRVAAFAVGVESGDAASLRATGALVAHLLCSPESPALAGAELVVTAGAIGLRSHPRVGATVVLGGPVVPDWFDDVLEELVR